MIRFRRQLFVAVIFFVIITLFTINIVIFLRKPVLVSMTPQRAATGDSIVIKGRYLGRRDPRNSLAVGTQRITSSYILEWEEDRIAFRMPEGLPSGDLVVFLPQGKSNSLLLTNVASIPKPIVGNLMELRRMDARLLPNSAGSLWEISTGEHINPVGAVFSFAGTALTRDALLNVSGEKLELYLPFERYWKTLGGIEPRRGAFLDLLQLLPSDQKSVVFPLEIRTGKSIAPILSEAGDSGISSEPKAPLLFGWEFNLSNNLPRDGDGSVVLDIPLPQVSGLEYRLYGSMRGDLQVLSSSFQKIRIRLFPRPLAKGAFPGSIRILFYAPRRQPQSRPSDYLENDVPYAEAEALFPLYSDFLEPATQFLLKPVDRSELVAYRSDSRSEAEIVRSTYQWFSRTGINSELVVSAYVDELRRLGIGARTRNGFIRRGEGEVDVALWVEVFFPQRGWISVYTESIVYKVGFGTVLHEYVPMPVENFSPRMEDQYGKIIYQGFTLKLLRSEP